MSTNDKNVFETNQNLTSKIKNINTKMQENENCNNLLKKETFIINNDLDLNKFRENENEHFIVKLNTELSEEKVKNSDSIIINEKFMLDDNNLEININNLIKNKRELESCLEINEKLINEASLELTDKTQFFHEKQ